MVLAWLACENNRNKIYIIHNVGNGRPHASLEQLVARMTQFAYLHEVTGVASIDSEQDHVRSALVTLKVRCWVRAVSELLVGSRMATAKVVGRSFNWC